MGTLKLPSSTHKQNSYVLNSAVSWNWKSIKIDKNFTSEEKWAVLKDKAHWEPISVQPDCMKQYSHQRFTIQN